MIRKERKWDNEQNINTNPVKQIVILIGVRKQ